MSDNLRKRIIRIFKNEGLKITIEANLSSTEFLYVTLDLRNNKYYPYRKPNDNPVYVNMKSNHPPTILKQILSMVSTRLSKLPCSEEEFHKSKPFYEDILKKSGYSEGLVYKPNASKPAQFSQNRILVIIKHLASYKIGDSFTFANFLTTYTLTGALCGTGAKI